MKSLHSQPKILSTLWVLIACAFALNSFATDLDIQLSRADSVPTANRKLIITPLDVDSAGGGLADGDTIVTNTDNTGHVIVSNLVGTAYYTIEITAPPKSKTFCVFLDDTPVLQYATNCTVVFPNRIYPPGYVAYSKQAVDALIAAIPGGGGGGGSGNVTGPVSSTAHHVSAFASNTGKQLEDTGILTSDVARISALGSMAFASTSGFDAIGAWMLSTNGTFLTQWARYNTNQFANTNAPVIHTPTFDLARFNTNPASGNVAFTVGGDWIFAHDTFDPGDGPFIALTVSNAAVGSLIHFYNDVWIDNTLNVSGGISAVNGGAFFGNGGGLTGLHSSQLTGLIPVATMGTGPASSTTFLRGDNVWAIPSGGGNFSGPGTAVSGNFMSFNGTSGTVGQDSGFGPSSFVTTAQAIASSNSIILQATNFATAATNSLGLQSGLAAMVPTNRWATTAQNGGKVAIISGGGTNLTSTNLLTARTYDAGNVLDSFVADVSSLAAGPVMTLRADDSLGAGTITIRFREVDDWNNALLTAGHTATGDTNTTYFRVDTLGAPSGHYLKLSTNGLEADKFTGNGIGLTNVQGSNVTGFVSFKSATNANQFLVLDGSLNASNTLDGGVLTNLQTLELVIPVASNATNYTIDVSARRKQKIFTGNTNANFTFSNIKTNKEIDLYIDALTSSVPCNITWPAHIVLNHFASLTTSNAQSGYFHIDFWDGTDPTNAVVTGGDYYQRQ